MLKTSAKRATVSQRPTTVMYCEKPLPVSAPYTGHVTDHADHVADHALITCLIIHCSRV